MSLLICLMMILATTTLSYVTGKAVGSYVAKAHLFASDKNAEEEVHDNRLIPIETTYSVQP